MALQALIFDVDGTLADTEEAHRVAFNATFRAGGLDWEWNPDLYRKLLKVAGGRERIRHFIESCRPALPGQVLSDKAIAALHADKTRRYREMVSAGTIPLRPGVARLIDEARAAGVRLAIATTTSRTNVTALLKAALGADAIHWFEVIAAAEQAERKKPAPDIYRWVLQRMALNPQQCLALEDSANGLRAAHTAGIPTLVAPSVYTREEAFAGAVGVVDDLSDITLSSLRDLVAPPPHPQEKAS